MILNEQNIRLASRDECDHSAEVAMVAWLRACYEHLPDGFLQPSPGSHIDFRWLNGDRTLTVRFAFINKSLARTEFILSDASGSPSTFGRAILASHPDSEQITSFARHLAARSTSLKLLLRAAANLPGGPASLPTLVKEYFDIINTVLPFADPSVFPSYFDCLWRHAGRQLRLRFEAESVTLWLSLWTDPSGCAEKRDLPQEPTSEQVLPYIHAFLDGRTFASVEADKMETTIRQKCRLISPADPEPFTEKCLTFFRFFQNTLPVETLDLYHNGIKFRWRSGNTSLMVQLTKDSVYATHEWVGGTDYQHLIYPLVPGQLAQLVDEYKHRQQTVPVAASEIPRVEELEVFLAYRAGFLSESKVLSMLSLTPTQLSARILLAIQSAVQKAKHMEDV